MKPTVTTKESLIFGHSSCYYSINFKKWGVTNNTQHACKYSFNKAKWYRHIIVLEKQLITYVSICNPLTQWA